VARTPTMDSAEERRLTVLLDEAERALNERQADLAAARLRDAAAIRPDDARLAFLNAQLIKERERAVLARARSAAASGDFDRALAVLDSADSGGSADLAEVRRALNQQQIDERVRELLRSAQDRLARGAIIEPPRDNARFYVQSALALAPRDPAAGRAADAVTRRVLEEARAAALKLDSPTVERLLQIAREDGASAGAIEAVRNALREARNQQRNAEISRLNALVAQRVAQDQLLEPADDSARYWFEKLRELDANAAATSEARQALHNRLLDRARTTLAAGDTDGASRLLAAAESVAGRTPLGTEIGNSIAAAIEKARAARQVVGANSLKRTRFVEPVFPAGAIASKTAGWVDLEFTVRTDGSVGDVQVLAAEPPGLFDNAAVSALGKWRFEPVRRDGSVVEQRARLRLRFTLPED
ncbi:MAG: energy transducer TonB, partial [Steroidobacteraceae bacterium]|nr:energy transducer TonB [Steroidobacteraceae bacterium]